MLYRCPLSSLCGLSYYTWALIIDGSFFGGFSPPAGWLGVSTLPNLVCILHSPHLASHAGLGPEIPLLCNFLISLPSCIQWEQTALSILSLCWQRSCKQGPSPACFSSPFKKSFCDKESNYKIGKGPKQALFKGGHTKGPETYERMLSITSHQRDAN